MLVDSYCVVNVCLVLTDVTLSVEDVVSPGSVLEVIAVVRSLEVVSGVVVAMWDVVVELIAVEE